MSDSLKTVLNKETYDLIMHRYKEYSKSNTISLDEMKDICSEVKGMDIAVLNSTIKEIRQKLDKKNLQGTITLKEDDFFNYIELIFRDQEQSKNENDPEMDRLFKSLIVGNNDVIYKKKLIEIINTFELSIDLDQFFKPIRDIQEINFNDFCTLFKSGSAKEEEMRKSFYSILETNAAINVANIEPEEKENMKEIKQANFPIKCVA